MGNKGPTIVNRYDTAEEAEQVSASSDAAGQLQLPNVQMEQNVVVIWLDKNIDEDNSTDCRNTIVQLRSVVNTVRTFTDADKCNQFLESMNNEKACMIISGSMGLGIVPRIHDMFQVDSIFIFCGNKERYEQWANDYSKIKGVFRKNFTNM